MIIAYLLEEQNTLCTPPAGGKDQSSGNSNSANSASVSSFSFSMTCFVDKPQPGAGVVEHGDNAQSSRCRHGYIASMGWILFMQKKGLWQQLIHAAAGCEKLFFTLGGLVLMMELLGYGARRLNRLKQAALANYRQVNEEGRADGLDVAMEHLRRCACDALQTDDIIVEDIPDEERAKQADRDYEEQKDAFFRRNMAGAMGRCAAPAGTAVLAPGEIKKKIEAVLQQAAAPESWERRRLR